MSVEFNFLMYRPLILFKQRVIIFDPVIRTKSAEVLAEWYVQIKPCSFEIAG
jgi:hypothetical protein